MHKNSVDSLDGINWVRLRFNNACEGSHQIFYKEHDIKKQLPEHPKGRTLFVANLPSYSTIGAIKREFSKVCGPVAKVNFEFNKGLKDAYIVFQKETSIAKAMNLSKDYMITLSTDDHPILVGYKKYEKEYLDSYINEAEVLKKCEDYLKKYDEKEAKAKKKEMALEIEDEEGWTTVTARKKRGKKVLPMKTKIIDRVRKRVEEKNTKKQLKNFYTFQIREAKKRNVQELQKNFESDKKKIYEMKTSRRFKPV